MLINKTSCWKYGVLSETDIKHGVRTLTKLAFLNGKYWKKYTEMAKSAIPVPACMDMDGDLATNWDFFRDCWSNYATANELGKKPKEVVAAILLSVVGKSCFKVFKNLPMPDGDRKDADKIIQRLSEEFESKRNIIYERYVFNSCSQKADEKFDRYLTRLRELISTCKYDTLEEEMLRDRIVIGIHDGETQQRLLREKDLNLERTITICRSSETAMQQANKMEQTVNFVKQHKSDSRVKDCKYCGMHHKKGKCSAYGETCTRCGKKNHLATVCMSNTNKDSSKYSKQKDKAEYKYGSKKRNTKRINQFEERHDNNSSDNNEDLDSEESIYMYSLGNDKDKKQFHAKVTVKVANSDEEEKEMVFQLDTGAACSTLSVKDYNKITTQQFQPTHVTLKMYDESTLKPVGQTKLSCTANGITRKIHFQIVKDATVSLLSGNACQALKLIKFNENIFHISASPTREQIVQEFNDVFEGLGKLPGEYHIETDTNVKPVQNNPRRVPIPLKEELKKKIEELEKLGIIAKVSEPTQWISSMVAVKTPNKLRICLDPQELNKAVIRNNYKMPTIDEVAP